MPSLTRPSDGREAFGDGVAEGHGEATAEPAPLGLSKKEDCTQPRGAGGWTFNGRECPHEGRLAFDRTTGEAVWSASCKNARCERCSRRYARRTFGLARTAIDGCAAHRDGGCEVCAAAVPARVRFITLTTRPGQLETWQEKRLALQHWRESLARHGVAGEMLYVAEQGSQTGMHHVHVVQHGPRKIPMDLLDRSWSHGWTQVESARGAVDYVGKQALRYVGKGADARETIEAHMNLNGGRAAHWTRGFFGGVGRDAWAREHPIAGLYFVQVSEPGYAFTEGAQDG